MFAHLCIFGNFSKTGFFWFFSLPAAKIGLISKLIVWLSLEMVVEIRIRKVLVMV